MYNGTVFAYDHIIEKFFVNHHDKVGMENLKKWREWSKQEFFDLEVRKFIYRLFLRRRKQILDPKFRWTPANNDRFVELNYEIYRVEIDLYKHLKLVKQSFKELYEKGHHFIEEYTAYSKICYGGYYIEGEDDDFPTLLWMACPESYKRMFVRNAVDSFSDHKLEKPTLDWGYDFKGAHKECAAIKSFQRLPLHKHAGFLMFDSQIYALQDFVNMFICFEHATEISLNYHY